MIQYLPENTDSRHTVSHHFHRARGRNIFQKSKENDVHTLPKYLISACAATSLLRVLMVSIRRSMSLLPPPVMLSHRGLPIETQMRGIGLPRLPCPILGPSLQLRCRAHLVGGF